MWGATSVCFAPFFLSTCLRLHLDVRIIQAAMNCFVDELENILFRAFCFEGRRKKLLDDQALTRDGLLSISDAVHAQSLAAFATDFSALKCAQLACRVLHAHFVSTHRLKHARVSVPGVELWHSFRVFVWLWSILLLLECFCFYRLSGSNTVLHSMIGASIFFCIRAKCVSDRCSLNRRNLSYFILFGHTTLAKL